jgi:hypothetical protein
LCYSYRQIQDVWNTMQRRQERRCPLKRPFVVENAREWEKLRTFANLALRTNNRAFRWERGMPCAALAHLAFSAQRAAVLMTSGPSFR